MSPANFCALAQRLMRHPAVPYHEHALRAEVEKICAEHNLPAARDEFGNLLVHLRSRPSRRPLVLAAHLDHPGFEIVKRRSRNSWLARFRGGVPESYFRPGTRVLLMPGERTSVLGRREHKTERVFRVETNAPAEPPPSFAVWDLRPFAKDAAHIRGRACDDLIGAVSVLATLIDLKASKARVHVIGVFSRAEEVGFHGALALAASRKLPKDSLVISLETSRELPGVKMGEGVILRVGDRASVFDPAASRFLAEVAAELKAKTGFVFQRGLMSGGTCEATAYQELGLRSAAVCVALGNYHNCGGGGQIREEYVSIKDACGMVEFLVEASRKMAGWDKLVARLPQRLQRYLREARSQLRQSANA